MFRDRPVRSIEVTEEGTFCRRERPDERYSPFSGGSADARRGG
jgi:hypothetical protein